MIKKTLGAVVALVCVCTLFGAENAFNGTWKLNLAKSSDVQFGPEGKLIKKSEVKDSTITVAVDGDTTTVRSHVTIAGQPISSAFTVPTTGGPLNYTEGSPPEGITDTLKIIDDRTDEFLSKMNGKVVLTTRVEVTPNRKTMTVRRSGVDENGKAFQTVEVYDHLR